MLCPRKLRRRKWRFHQFNPRWFSSQKPSMKVTQAIGARNLLKSYAKQREAQQEQLRALIVEKKSELDRWEKCIMIRIQIIVITNIICTEAHFGERKGGDSCSLSSAISGCISLPPLPGCPPSTLPWPRSRRSSRSSLSSSSSRNRWSWSSKSKWILFSRIRGIHMF